MIGSAKGRGYKVIYSFRKVTHLTVILIIDDLILELQFREFWKQNDNGKYSVIAEIRQLQVLLAKKKRCPKEN